ncbi:MAG: DNA internalization-related competence protein ComEC/Rec2 [Candidatus Coprovivens sp.]
MLYKINNEDYESIYNINDTKFNMVIKDYEYKDGYVSLTLCNKECIVGNYYYDNVSDINYIKYGSNVLVEGILEVPSSNTIHNQFNYKNYLYNKDIYYVIKISKIKLISNEVNILYDIRNYINERIDSIDKTGYMKAFILGIKDNIDSNQYSNYQSIGVTHLFALSGMHISVIVLILNKLLSKLGNIRYLFIDVILIFYGFILYYPASLKRTILFYVINSICKLFKLDISNIKVLLLVLFSLVIYNYKIIYDIGFIYSFITVLGILLSNEFVNGSNIKLSIVAFLFSLPISLYYFYSINIFSIIYNLFYIFIVSSVIYPLSLICFIIPKLYFIYSFLIGIMVYVTDLLSNIDIGIINISFNIVEVILWYLMLYIFIKYNKKIMILGLFSIIFIDILIPYLDSNYYVYYFDVGQGDSSLIISPYRKDIILIDTGGIYGRNVSDNYLNYMKSEGIKRIDYMILSHGDFDHMGDASYVIDNIDVDNVIFNCGEFNELELDLIKILDNKKINYYSCIDELNIYDNKLYFINDNIYDNENDNSSVIYSSFYGRSLLFMGDAGRAVEKDIIDTYELNKIDILKAGHHGSNTSSDKEFIQYINPQYAIISVGSKNRYGHPKSEVLEILEDSEVYRTDMDGSVIFKINDDFFDLMKFDTK